MSVSQGIGRQKYRVRSCEKQVGGSWCRSEESRFGDKRVRPHSNCSRPPSATMAAPQHIPLLLILFTHFASGLASDSFNDFSDNIDNAEEDGIEPSRFQKFIAKFEQEQDMRELEADMEEDQMLGDSAPIVVRQAPDKIVSPEEPLMQVSLHSLEA